MKRRDFIRTAGAANAAAAGPSQRLSSLLLHQPDQLSPPAGSSPAATAGGRASRTSDGMYVAELGGITQKLQTTVGEVYTLGCAADLGDARCDLELAALEESGSVAKW